ncbi:3,4-dihydroxy-2-butanone-4-phosphate synthase [Oceanobacillus kapialis]|uniref:3,4-dihydroxy-2-butanone 4-phosphate synthase n=1 Tax=Oceanobacillus kapialis TaxID=481353 RepID=A0ABW5Q1I7_9BACI
MFHTIEEAIEELRAGNMVIVVDDANRENEGDLVGLAEKATPEMINFMITHGKGLVCTAITSAIAKSAGLELMKQNSTDPLSTAFTVSIDHITTTTGISAQERSTTIRALVDQQLTPNQFKQPGHVFPLIAKDEGVLVRRGHTEAAVDLAILSDAAPSGVICEIIKEDGTMALVPDLVEMAKQFGLKMITIEDLAAFRKKQQQYTMERG